MTITMAVALPVHSPHAPMLELFNDMLFEAPVSTIDGAGVWRG